MASVGGIDLTGATIAAFGALLVYDVFFVTFDQEVNLVWPSRWGVAKVLFLLNRYLPFVDTFLSLHLLLGINTSRECLLGFRAVTWLIVIGIIIAELILMLRTYALWGSRRWVLILLGALTFSVYIPALVVTQLEVMSLAYDALPQGCAKTRNSSPIIFVAFLLLIINETTIVALTLLSLRYHNRQHRSALVQQMLKDGIYYYIFLLAFSLVNLLIAVAAPPQFANWLTTPQRVFHSLLCTRVLLHIRAFASNEQGNPTTITQTDMSFTPGASPADTEASGVETSADRARRRRGKGKAKNFDSTASGIAGEFATASPDLSFGGDSAWSGSGTTSSGSGLERGVGLGSGSASGVGSGSLATYYAPVPLASSMVTPGVERPEAFEMQRLALGDRSKQGFESATVDEKVKVRDGVI